eukprot:c11996_g5_i1.p1 GENE.c11996_g5_i1~~c11996_g5_i1.p1  ORF type:complete len:807 (+),score=170.25 c11996_g5_i1:117-2423(+)
MYRKWKYLPFPLKSGHVTYSQPEQETKHVFHAIRKPNNSNKSSNSNKSNSNNNSYNPLAPPVGYFRHNCIDYSLVLESIYVKRSATEMAITEMDWPKETHIWVLGTLSGTAEQGNFYEIAELPPESVHKAGGHLESLQLRLSAESYATSAASKDAGMQRLIDSWKINKTNNMSGDAARYTAHAARMRTEKREVCVVVIRRMFIPPVGEKMQDIVVRYYGTLGLNQVGREVGNIQMIVNSLTPLSPVTFFDDTTAEVRSTGMLFDEESTVFFDGMGFPPYVYDGAEALFKSVCAVLAGEAGLDHLNPVAPGVPQDDIQLISDPFEIIFEMESEAVGLSLTSPSDHWACWREKVARYFAHVLDGGLHEGYFDIKNLVDLLDDQTGVVTPRAIQTIERLLDYALFFRPAGRDFDHTNGLFSKLADVTPTLKFVCNERVMCTLLRTHYIMTGLPDPTDRGLSKYAIFLKILITRSETSVPLAEEAALQIALLSSDSTNRAMLVSHGLIPILVDFLRLSHSGLLLAVARALVNLTDSNKKAKADVILENGAQYIVQHSHLLTQNDEVVKALCVLLKNCASAEDSLRQRITREGVPKHLVALLREPKIEGVMLQDEVIVKAAGALWNLCGCEEGRDAVSSEGGVAPLVHLIVDSRNEEVIEKASGALMSLCATFDTNKRQATDMNIAPRIIHWMSNAKGPRTIRNVTSLAAVLSMEPSFRRAVSMHPTETANAIERVSRLVDIDEALVPSKRSSHLTGLGKFVAQFQENMAQGF